MVAARTLRELGIAPGNPCFVIAEAGVNHNGDMDAARTLVREAKRAGADCVKFQTFAAERVATRTAPKAAYQLRVTDPAESQIDMLRALELSRAAHQELLDLCRREEILFLSTPYNLEDAEMLDGLGVAAFKLASIHLVEIPFLRQMARLRKPLILSTGMATMREAEQAVAAVRSEGLDELVVLQCTTNYPSDVADANLRAMLTMRDTLQVTVGYSDHTEGTAAAIAATALGATVLEKHFTLDRSLPGPDQRCSSDPAEFAALVRAVREVEAALGSAVKEPTAAEQRNMSGMRRSIVARVPILAGTVLTEDVLIFKRPGTGLPPSRLPEIVGRRTRIDIDADTQLELQHLL